MFEIVYQAKVIDDLASIDKANLIRIRDAIERKLSTKPALYGVRLRGELREYWKLRVGDYRVVYKIKDRRVIILTIAHRKKVYGIANERM